MLMWLLLLCVLLALVVKALKLLAVWFVAGDVGVAVGVAGVTVDDVV